METALAIASKRDVRRYSDDPVPPGTVESILQSGRIAGTSKNRQARRFVVLDRLRLRAAELVTRPDNVRGAPLAIAIVTSRGSHSDFDAGRAAQNMMLAAWADGVVSCPNAIAQPDAFVSLLNLSKDEKVTIVISFGLPSRTLDPNRRSPPEWMAVADRIPLDALVKYQ